MRFIGNDQAETHSVIMRAQSRTIRYIRSIHYLPSKAIDLSSGFRHAEAM
ncbi:hypothetical protein [Paenibacillus sp. D2_2]